MFYTIYKTTNLLNGKFYIGKHKTKNLNDGYLGSGKLLKRAIKKYGIENFHKEILFEFRSEKHMNALEKILVVPDLEINYNLCDGGKGGFGYINCNKLNFDINSSVHKNILSVSRKKGGDNKYKKYGVFMSEAFKQAGKTSFKGKLHKKETKIVIGLKNSENQKGSKNSQYGTCWVTNGIENKKIKKEKLDFWLNKGYNKGRKIKLGVA
jgi:hypothetical protein